jgi:hypothetical protein
VHVLFNPLLPRGPAKLTLTGPAQPWLSSAAVGPYYQFGTFLD